MYETAKTNAAISSRLKKLLTGCHLQYCAHLCAMMPCVPGRPERGPTKINHQRMASKYVNPVFLITPHLWMWSIRSFRRDKDHRQAEAPKAQLVEFACVRGGGVSLGDSASGMHQEILMGLECRRCGTFTKAQTTEGALQLAMQAT